VIRPEAARWFEILVARDDAFVALEALAMTGTVEIEWRRGTLQQEDAAQVNRSSGNTACCRGVTGPTGRPRAARDLANRARRRARGRDRDDRRAGRPGPIR
jgi:hypothetical protein